MTAPYIIQIIIGFIGLIALAVPFSNNAKIINYKYILYGVLAQIVLAAFLLKIPFPSISLVSDLEKTPKSKRRSIISLI